MSHSEAEALVRRFYDVIHGSSTIEEAMPELEQMLHPDAEYVSPPDALEPGTRRGIDGWRAALTSGAEGLGHQARFEIVDLIERDDRVYVTIALHTGGTASGVELTGPTVGAVLSIEDRLIRRFEWRWKPEDARALFER